MIDVSPDTLALSLVEDVAQLLGLTTTCFYLALGSRVLRDSVSLVAEGVGSDSVIRACARLRGRMQPVNGGFRSGGFGGGGDFGQWTCTKPQCSQSVLAYLDEVLPVWSSEGVWAHS